MYEITFEGCWREMVQENKGSERIVNVNVDLNFRDFGN